MALLFCLVLAACGYQPLYATPAGEAFHVHLAKNQVASAMVAEEVVRGAREALVKDGALASGEGYPRLEIEVLRADESSEGIVREPGDVPAARASDLAVIARAYVVRHAGAPPELDTGDVRAQEMVGAPTDSSREAWQREDSLRAVARRLGSKLALRVLGHPSSGEPAGSEALSPP
ncbi:MAG TPA: hypothetical protein VLM85_29875 [Polyangiaceae bacterium]|nr:hypothetical protein [Polyangiaceae bacterium]